MTRVTAPYCAAPRTAAGEPEPGLVRFGESGQESASSLMTSGSNVIDDRMEKVLDDAYTLAAPRCRKPSKCAWINKHSKVGSDVHIDEVELVLGPAQLIDQRNASSSWLFWHRLSSRSQHSAFPDRKTRDDFIHRVVDKLPPKLREHVRLGIFERGLDYARC